MKDPVSARPERPSDDLAPAAPADLRALTSLRFIAALWVALFAYWPALDIGFMPSVVAKGYLGVELFFVLSGFILCHVYLESFGAGRLNYRSFLWARIARVYPMHIATLIGIGLLGAAALVAGIGFSNHILSWASLPAHIFMVQAWGLAPEASWNHPSWSISAEWFAYLAFPGFAALAWSLRTRPVVAVIAALVFLAGLYAAFETLTGFPLTRATIAWGVLRIVPCFAFGCALYLLHRRGALARPGLIAAILAVLLVVASQAGIWDALIVIVCGGLILALASLPNKRAGLLASPAGVYLGEISYSLYMMVVPWKLVSVNLAARLTGASDDRLHIIVWLVLFAALPVVSAIAYHLVEYPARKSMRAWGQRREDRKTGGRYAAPAI